MKQTTIRKHLDAIAQSGFYDSLFSEAGTPTGRREETMMQTELSLAFPLLNEAGRAILQLAWSAQRGNDNKPESSSAEQGSSYDTIQSAVENLVEYGQFTDAQVAFISTEMLGIDLPDWAVNS